MKIIPNDNRLLNEDIMLDEVLEIEGSLTLDPSSNVMITTSKNIIVTGKLISKPNQDVVHTIRFVGIDESKFVGGGEQVISSDIGLWITNNGQLDLRGSAPFDWRHGIDIEKDYDDLTQFAGAIGSNMNIQGTITGKSHVFIKSTQPQFIGNVQFRWMGPRKDISGDGIKELVTGRYACHFHHSENGSRGSIIEYCIARDCNNHVFVPHGSHGITMRNNIVHNVIEAPFWYDFGHKTNDLVWENNLVVRVSYVPRSQDQDSGGAPTFGAGGFVLGFGDGNKCNNNVVINTSGDPRAAGAYIWPELRDDNDNTKQLESSWEFENNTAINCPSGEQVWQNNNFHHIIRNSTIIGCKVPIFHGAYQNDYCRIGGLIKGGYVDIRAASATTNRIRFEGVTFDADGGDYCVVISEGPLNGKAPILFRNCKFINYKNAAILNQNPGPGLKTVDVIDCGLQPYEYLVPASKSGEFIRIQQGGKAWKITKSGITQIPLFAPTLWGTGNGLLAEYFTPDFKILLLARIEPNINLFDITHPQIHYKVPSNFAARWTGKIQPQYSETFTFYCFAGGGVRLWVNNVLLIDKWAEKYPGNITSKTIGLIAGQLYDIKLEFFNLDDRSGCTLEWASGTLKREFIPMCQLYTGVIPKENKPPIVNAGQDITITLPTDTVELNGFAIDQDGTIVSYQWSYISGPAQFIIANGDKHTCLVGNLIEGLYTFRLACIDNKGAIAFDDVNITVKPAPNEKPIADAGQDQLIGIGFTLFGRGMDTDGVITSHKWEQVSGPACVITDPTMDITKVLPDGKGEYVFRLTVTDDKGAVGTDEVKVSIN